MLPFNNRSLTILFLIIIAGLLFVGYKTVFTNQQQKVKNIPFEILAEEKVPAQLKEIYERKKQKPGFARWDENNTTFLLINMGEKPTGGYSVEVKEIKSNAKKATVKVFFKEPGPEDIVVQIITFPHVYLKAQKLPAELEVIEEKTSKKIPPLN